MVRDGSIVASTIALLERQLARTSTSASRENLDSSMDESTIKYNSSTDSGKDDHSLTTSNSSITSSSDKDYNNCEGDTVCCKDDFHWVSSTSRNQSLNEAYNETERRGRERKKVEEVKLRKMSTSLDRGGRKREKRDHKCRSSYFSQSPSRGDCSCHMGEYIPPQYWPPSIDYRHCQKDYFHFYRPFPCDYSYRCPKPTTDIQEQVRRLESDKESLTLQVAVLTDQVDAQAEKISDLERMIESQKRQLTTSEDILQREMLTRSSLETQKLELLAVVSELKRHETTLERDNIELRERLADERRKNKPPLAPRGHLYPTSASTPNALDKARGLSPSPSPVALGHGVRKLDYDSTPTSQRQFGMALGAGYRSLPREQVSGGDSGLRRAVVFGRPTDQPRCSSVPNLAETETVMNEKEIGESYSQESSPSMQTSAPKGIRKIFGKIKRSGSGNLDELPQDEPFTRGGIRSTAGPRLCGSTTSAARSEVPFAEWNIDYICDWLKEIGLDSSIPEARRWIKSGSSLLSATPHEIDKELNIKNGLLRKKLHLALEAERGSGSDPMLSSASRLEAGWVLRWLDDIGLPQYKAGFMSARIDGRVLHRLTLDDLHSLHISLALHVASIRTGIQVLRKESFDPHCLVRRSDPEAEERVELWTNHRVMEWLRAIDLAEYAPNLRGSGVHGGLMIHEEKFTDSLLAALLSIPQEKTLLRRHLSTHFKDLVGNDIMQKKREAESVLGYIPLTTTSKAKIPKKSQFTLKRKKSKYDLDEGELVCPLDFSKSNQSTEISKSSRGCLS
nr:liprin-beta-1 isoform X4 [Halyomorpha halys]